MSIYCVYHRKHAMRVVNEEDRKKLLSSKEWFDHPIKEGTENERPLRKCTRKGRSECNAPAKDE